MQDLSVAIVSGFAEVAPYLAPYFLTQITKNNFNVHRRVRVFLPFIFAWLLLLMRELGIHFGFSWQLIPKIIYEGALIGSVSIAVRNFLTKTVQGK